MKTGKIKKDIANAMAVITPNNYQHIISKIKNNEGVILEMENKKEKKYNYYKIVLATILLFVFTVIGFNYFTNKTLATISIDVNPSVELMISKDKKITKVVAKNADGQKILGNMDLKNSTIEVATNALIGSMLKLGYIDELKNSVLLTIIGNNSKANESIRLEIAKNIDELLKAIKIDGSIISQSLSNEKQIEKLANENNITIGKAKLIQEILNNNNLYTFVELSTLSVNELNLLATSKINNVTTLNIEGSASDKVYIGKESAKNIALSNAELTNSNISYIEIELDYEKGKMVYDVEFNYQNKEFDYEIDAKTGEIIKSFSEFDDDYVDENKIIINTDDEGTTITYITKVKAKEIALNHAKVNNVKDFDIEFEYVSGKATYEIEFEANNKEYDYIIDAISGNIIRSKNKTDIDLFDDKDDD